VTSIRRRSVDIVSVTVGVLVVLVVTDTGPRWTLVLPVVVAFAALWWLLADALQHADPGETTAAGPADDPRIRSDARTRSLRISLMSLDDHRRDRLHATLTALIDEQLAVAHGVDRATQPEEARALMGEELHDFVSKPAGPSLSFRRLDRIVSAIEGL
jgi:hypothetical protein